MPRNFYEEQTFFTLLSTVEVHNLMELASDPMEITSDPMELASDPMEITSDPMELASDPMEITSDPNIRSSKFFNQPFSPIMAQ